jgi:GT2 family glycosyltransferase
VESLAQISGESLGHGQGPTATVHVLGYNSRPYLRACLQAVVGQTYRPLEVIFSDNASIDGSAEYVRDIFPDVRVIANATNLGYCGGHNQGLRASRGEFVIVLNPDVLLTPDFVSTIINALETRPEVGAATGRLRRCGFDPDSQRFLPLEPPVLDSTGVFLDRRRRALDRGAGTVDDGRFASPAPVFAACGAAALYRRQMLEEIAQDGEYFDESFFLSLEDVDIGWRAQRSGWSCLYVGEAIAYHVRKVHGQPGLRELWRRPIPPELRLRQRHDLKNRYLMMLKNEASIEIARDLIWLLPWELLRLLAIAVVQPQALPGLLGLISAAPAALRRRRINSAKSHEQRFQLRHWFGSA